MDRLGTRIRFRLGLAYDHYSEPLGFDRIAERLSPEPIVANEPYEPRIDGEIPPITVIVGTNRAGLLLVEGPRVTRLFRGSDFYGISKRDGRWYAFHRQGGNGRIISFRLEGSRAVDPRTEIAGLNRGVHQIDFIHTDLWITDTYRDRVLVVPMRAIGRRWRSAAREIYPVGRLQIGRAQSRHAHFNSVFGWDGGVYLVAHNETVKTCRGSELFLLDDDGGVCERQEMGGSCCHNIGLLGGRQVTCRSVEGTVAVDGSEVLRLDGFARGLSLADDHHVVGVSPLGTDRVQRNEGEGGVVVTSPTFERLATVHLPQTQVHEVRRVDAPDLGLSATCRSSSRGTDVSEPPSTAVA